MVTNLISVHHDCSRDISYGQPFSPPGPRCYICGHRAMLLAGDNVSFFRLPPPPPPLSLTFSFLPFYFLHSFLFVALQASIMFHPPPPPRARAQRNIVHTTLLASQGLIAVLLGRYPACKLHVHGPCFLFVGDQICLISPQKWWWLSPKLTGPAPHQLQRSVVHLFFSWGAKCLKWLYTHPFSKFRQLR